MSVPLMKPGSWKDVMVALRRQPRGARIAIWIGALPHPQFVGMSKAIGLPVGQSSDYRLRLPDGSGLHVQEFDDTYRVHLDRVHPRVSFVTHLRQDAPKTFIATTSVLGTCVGVLYGKTLRSGLTGAAVAGLCAALLAAVKK